ncbi:MAG: polyprenyl synthetase family protein [Candidatus Moranbacteria bacterium]|nr:polyprenyl synthetase family protein [Candidatus Moranbacteria bacterium]
MENKLQAIEMLTAYKKRLDPHLKEFFLWKIAQAEKVDPLLVKTIKIIEKLVLSGGKRIRPALVYYGYLAAGGNDSEKIIKASTAIELAHAFLLIHDDIIDRDDTRHGIETAHKYYEKWGKKLGLRDSEATHFGNSMAITTGDYAHALADEILYDIDFEPEVILDALRELQKIVARTIPGEMLDVLMGAKGSATEKEITRMHEGKTARYTFEGPLHLGAVLAGQKKNGKLLEAFSAYSLPVGKAFQIRDDILGVFGNEKKLGKSVGADIIEGKQTLLVFRALKNGTKEQIKEINRLLGKKDLTEKEAEAFRRIVRETGSLEYSQGLAGRFVAESLVALEKIEFKNNEAKNFLESIAEYIIKREV